MSVVKYEIISPVTLSNKPYFDTKNRFIIPNVNPKYKWYLEVARNNPITRLREYFILFSENKFDDHCRKCKSDFKGRILLYLHGELNNYVNNETIARGNIECNYYHSENDYDVWQLE